MRLGSCPLNNMVQAAIVFLQLLKPLIWVQEEEIELNCIYLGKECITQDVQCIPRGYNLKYFIN